MVWCVATACADPAAPLVPNGLWTAAGHWAGSIVITQDPDDPRWPSDAVTINTVSVDGDSLTLNVSFAGGCKDHTFALLAETIWMESSPVQVRVRLAHDAHDDTCEAWLTRVVRFDLSPLKTAYAASYQATTGAIKLRLDNSPVVPTYGF